MRDRDEEEDEARFEDDEPKPKSKKRRSKKSERDSDDDRPRKRKSHTEGYDILGPRRKVFTPSISTLRVVAILFGTLAVAGMLSCILTMVIDMPNGTMFFVIIAVIGGLSGLLWCMNFLTLKVAVHVGGIVHAHRGETRIIPWENISSVTQAITEVYKNGSHVGTTYVYTLELTDLTQIVYTNRIQNVEDLGNIIIEQTGFVMLPQVRLVYERGEMVKFGRLGLNKVGLHYGKQVLDWDDIKGVKISEEYITVNKQGKWLKWCKIAASSVPNLHIFLTLVNEISGIDAG